MTNDSPKESRRQTKDVRLTGTWFLGKDGGEFTGIDDYQWIFSVAFDHEEIIAGEPFVKTRE